MINKNKYMFSIIIKLLKNPKECIRVFILKTARIWPDRLYLKTLFLLTMGSKLSLNKPKTYNEKLQWLKLYDRKPEYTRMVCKVEAKEYVSSIIGQEYIIPTLGVYNSVEEIDFDKLPNQFVLKCTHDSGGIVICKDKHKLDIEGAKNKLKKGLKVNYYYQNREWPYKNVVPRIIAEQYMEDGKTEELRDYKFFCFDGEVKALFIASERMIEGEETKFDFFDADFNHLPFLNGHPNAKIPPQIPSQFELMKQLASKLSQGIPQVRIDFYEMNGKVYFGEITFFHWSGMTPFIPKEWDIILGNWIKLPVKR